MRIVIKIGFPIICVVIVLGTMLFLSRMNKSVESTLQSQEYNTTSNITENEVTENEVLNEEFENEVIENREGYSVPLN